MKAMDEDSHAAPQEYEILIAGHLHPRWHDWFDGFVVENLANGQTRLYGSMTDQSALHGVLVKIRDLNLKLISVNNIDVKE